MEVTEKFGEYLDHIGERLGRTERKVCMKHYCSGLMMTLKRKSFEPLAAAIDPEHVQARHQSLQNFVADSPWSDEDVLSRVQSWVLPKMRAKHAGRVHGSRSRPDDGDNPAEARPPS